MAKGHALRRRAGGRVLVMASRHLLWMNGERVPNVARRRRFQAASAPSAGAMPRHAPRALDPVRCHRLYRQRRRGATVMRLQDKVAIVTGAGLGFGEGIAKRYAARAPRCWSPTSTAPAPSGWRARSAIPPARPPPTCPKAPTSSAWSRDHRGLRPPRHRGQQRRHHAPEPAAARGRRGDVRSRVRRQRQIDLLERAACRAGVPPPGRRLLRQHRVDRRATRAPASPGTTAPRAR